MQSQIVVGNVKMTFSKKQGEVWFKCNILSIFNKLLNVKP